jgi:outer membrane protein
MNGMQKNKSFFYVLTGLFIFLSLPLHAWDFCLPLDLAVEGRVAYYHPSSRRVRRVYGNGWPDYQIEISKQCHGFSLYGFPWRWNIDWRIWGGISGFSRKGESFGYHHNHTRLQLIPVSLGTKFFYPLTCNMDIYLGGGLCLSFLHITDHSQFVHKHTRREEWGGLIQSGITYKVCDCFYGNVIVSAFFDYFFQRFHFCDSREHSFCRSRRFHDTRFIERHDLKLNGYKVGVGLGMIF